MNCALLGGSANPVCLLGPSKEGDGCNEDSECASGSCAKSIHACAGIDEGMPCAPGSPDPCEANHYCRPDSSSRLGGTCDKAVSAGRPCRVAGACARGYFCAGPAAGAGVCTPVLSTPTWANTTLGPFMCATGTALRLDAGPPVIWQCANPAAANVSGLLGTDCDPAEPPPAAFECACAADGKSKLRPIGGAGLGAKAAAYKNLAACLAGAVSPLGKPCLYDAADLENVRYASCGYYACYPQYQALANSTGGRFYAPPLSQWW